jgi:predicted O-methyltransferase YrrM
VRIPRIWEHAQSNGNVKLRELGVLSAFAAECEDGTTLFEIGTFDGRTALNLALNSPAGCEVVTLDLPPDSETRFSLDPRDVHMVQKPRSGARYDKHREACPEVVNRIRQLFGDSAELDPAPYEQRCSLVFVDGSHAYDYVVSDTVNALRLIRAGGVIVWHDYGVWEGVTRGLEEIEESQRLGLQHIEGTSLVFWRKC